MRRRRRSFDPLRAQPRSPKRRPGSVNGQTDTQLDPNARFFGDQMGGGNA
ncbi:MAG TPA: hypothetical protein VG795_09265 [Acidimicrobiia bacterium]|nr:hypothetical protein [Acidimicrobiia bacterium]